MSERTIWKVNVPVDDEQTISAPGLTKVLHVAAESPTVLLLWVEVAPAEPNQRLTVYVRGTGHPLREAQAAEHVGSVQAGPFVWHVYTEAPNG